MAACWRIALLTGPSAAPISHPREASCGFSSSPSSCITPSCLPAVGSIAQRRKTGGTQVVEGTNRDRHWFSGGESRLGANSCGNSCHRQQRRRPSSSFPGSHGARPAPRAEAEHGTWGADDHDHSPLSSDNGASFFDYTSLHIVGSPSQGDGAASPALSVVAGAGASNRAGLYRAPISGGVQTATSSHGLPHPAIAVRNLIEQARYAHLCTIMSRMHHRRRGYPFGSLVEFAADSSGHPIFSLSPLAIHTRNLLADPRCTLVIQVPGWSGLANARVTLFGDVYPLSAEQQAWAHKNYTAKNQQGASQQWGNFNYYRMETISDVYFVGGFGTVAWVDVNEYEDALPDVIAANCSEQTLQELNSRFSKPLREILSAEPEELNSRFSKSVREVLSSEAEVDDAALISIDSKGVDIRVRQGAQFNVQRLPFQEDKGVETLDHAISALQKVLDKVSKIADKS